MILRSQINFKLTLQKSLQSCKINDITKEFSLFFLREDSHKNDIIHCCPCRHFMYMIQKRKGLKRMTIMTMMMENRFQVSTVTEIEKRA